MVWRWFALFFVLPAMGFDYDALKSLIEIKQLSTISEVIGELPTEYLENYSLMKKSRSLQGASPEAPRAILFGKDAKFILAFNGDASLRNYAALETIEFKEKEARFEFHSIQFPKDAGQSGGVEFSEANPKVCLTCHRGDPRPNWERYNLWPGAYGETDDYPKDEELAELENFLGKKSAHERYKHLVTAPGSSSSPYETYMRGRLRFRPNLRLLNFVFAYNTQRVVRMLHAHPRYSSFRWLFALSRLECPVTFDVSGALKRIFGESGAGSFGEWAAPDIKNAASYILRNMGFKERDFSTAFFPSAKDLPPYFFDIGTPRDLDYEHALTGPLELSDSVAGKIFLELAREIPQLRKYHRVNRFNEARYGKDPLDFPFATIADDVVRPYEWKEMRSACLLLAAFYFAAGAADAIIFPNKIQNNGATQTMLSLKTAATR